MTSVLPRSRPGSALFGISVQAEVVDPAGLWSFACLAAGRSGLTLEDAVAVLGDSSAPDVKACLAMILDPSALGGCVVHAYTVEGIAEATPAAEWTGMTNAPACPRDTDRRLCS